MTSSSMGVLKTRLSREGAAKGDVIGAQSRFLSRVSVSQQANANVGREGPGVQVNNQH